MKRLRCAIYTRKSSEEGLEQDFNSLDAQREACEAYIKSQKRAGQAVDLIGDDAIDLPRSSVCSPTSRRGRSIASSPIRSTA